MKEEREDEGEQMSNNTATVTTNVTDTVATVTTTTTAETKNVTRDGIESTIGIRPRPLICKPENVNMGCKPEPTETKCNWAPGAWQDATRTSAFQPYKVN